MTTYVLIALLLAGMAGAGCIAGVDSASSGAATSSGGTALALTPSGSFPSDGDANVALDLEGGFAAITFPEGIAIDEGTISVTLESTGVNYALGERLPDAAIGPSFAAVATSVAYDSDYEIDGANYNAIVVTVADQLELGMNYLLTLAAGLAGTAADGSQFELADDYIVEFGTPLLYRYVDAMDPSMYVQSAAHSDGYVLEAGILDDNTNNSVFFSIFDRNGQMVLDQRYTAAELSGYPALPASDFKLTGLTTRGNAIYACGWVSYGSDIGWCDKFTYSISGGSVTLTRDKRGTFLAGGARTAHIALDSEGYLYVVGMSTSGGNRSFVAKLSETADALTLVDSVLSDTGFTDENTYFGITIDDADNIYTCGYHQTGAGTYRSVVVRYDTNLDQQGWVGEYLDMVARTSGNVFFTPRLDESGDRLYVVGYSFSGGSYDNADPMIRVYDPSAITGMHDFAGEETPGDGILIDEVVTPTPRGGQPGIYYDLDFTSDGEMVVSGEFANSSGNFEVAVQQFRLVGGTQLESQYVATQDDSPYSDAGFAVAVDSGGNIVVGGVRAQAAPFHQYRTIWKLDRHLHIVADAPPD